MNKQNIELALERIELQVTCNWWDNLIYFSILLLCFSIVVSILNGVLHSTWIFIVFIGIIKFIIIQICEHFEKKKIKRRYKQ